MTTTKRCPDCGGEYLTGVERCFDCDVALVDVDDDSTTGLVDADVGDDGLVGGRASSGGEGAGRIAADSTPVDDDEPR